MSVPHTPRTSVGVARLAVEGFSVSPRLDQRAGLVDVALGADPRFRHPGGAGTPWGTREHEEPDDSAFRKTAKVAADPLRW